MSAVTGRWCIPALLFLLLARPAAAQLPAGPFTTAGGRLTIGGQASVAVSSPDHAYFDYSSYDYDVMRLASFDVSASLRPVDRLTLLGDLRLEGSTGGGSWTLRPYALFVRFRPWRDRPLDIQAGLIPPVFGAFSRRAYGTDNPLIGYPLAYQYLTSLRSDAIPASVDDLLRMRGRGWRASYPVGSPAPDSGLPLIDGLRYGSGVELHAGDGRPVEAAVALTSGSLSNPTAQYAGVGRQLSGRFALRPVTGLVLGVSASHGVFLAGGLRDEYAGSSGGTQAAVGFDAEFSRGHWLVRGEGVRSWWSLPRLQAPFIDAPLRALAFDVEGRYRIRPGLYAAARIDHLGFNTVTGSTARLPWDAPVSRLELGAGYSFVRNAMLKVAWQRNWRDVSTAQRNVVVSAQVLVWF